MKTKSIKLTVHPRLKSCATIYELFGTNMDGTELSMLYATHEEAVKTMAHFHEDELGSFQVRERNLWLTYEQWAPKKK